jgi:hypothetical protein
MKFLLIAASALAVGLCAAPAFAADYGVRVPDGPYVGAGWAGVTDSSNTLNAIQGRLGYRFMNYFGVEGEAAFGVGDTGIGSGLNAHLNHELGAYAVGYLPVNPDFDLFARAGWSQDDVTVSGGSSSLSGTADGFSWGAGGQYFWDGQNGVRADWTRQDFNHGGDLDVWGVSYTRRF